jgi:YgiT-type zinc finger domain-containing protein
MAASVSDIAAMSGIPSYSLVSLSMPKTMVFDDAVCLFTGLSKTAERYGCPVCGGEVEQKRVEKILRGGKNTAILRVDAEVCLHCGERMYATHDVRRFEQIRKNLAKNVVSEYKELGRTYQAVA